MRLLLFLFAVFMSGSVLSQPYGNEWIAFVSGQPYSAQQYFRIAIWKEGIYRVTYNDMQTAGVPVSTWFSPDRYQLYNKGKQQFIQVVDVNGDNIFGPGDHIEFYGKGNDGEYDRALYDGAGSHGNPYVSLFNDTASYFLTYSPFSASNPRMPVVSDNNYSDYQPEPWCIAEDFRIFGSSYNIGQRDFNDIGDNSFTEGEGYMSPVVGKLAPFDVAFNVRKYLSSGPLPRLETAVMGANTNYHPYQLLGDGVLLKDTAFIAYRLVKHSFDITNLGSSGSYILRFAPQADPFFSGNMNYMQMSHAGLRYPRTFDFTGEPLPRQFYLGGASKIMVEMNNISAQSPRFYCVGEDTVKLLTLSFSGSTYRSIIPVYGKEKRCILMDASQIYQVSGNAVITSVNLDSDPARFARFRNLPEMTLNPDFLIVSNKSLWPGAVDYAAYRQSKGYNVLLVDADELYDQFSWGIRKHILAIRNFCDFMIDRSGPDPDYLLLLGKSVTSQNAKSGPGYSLNLVPTYGEPASDVMFTSRLNSNRFVPELSTGRIAAQNNQDLSSYLDKLIAFETQQSGPPAEWMKHIMHFGGGTDIAEQNLLADKLGAYRTIIQDTLFGGIVNTVLKNSTDPIQINLSQFIQQRIDSGCTMMTFYGHAAGTSFDISTDDPEFYNNKDRYPVVLALSCFVGDIHTTSRLLNERFGGQAQAQMETFSGKMQDVANTIDNTKESMGDIIKSALTPLLDAFQLLPQSVQTSIVAFGLFITVAGTVAAAVTAIAAAIAVAAPLLGMSAATLGATALTGLGAAAYTAAAALGPVAIAIAAVWAAWKIGNTETVKNSISEWALSSDNLTAKLSRLVMGIDQMTPAAARAATAATAAAEAAQQNASAVNEQNDSQKRANDVFVSYTDQLTLARTQIANLTSEQKAQIKAGNDLGQSNDEIVKSMKVLYPTIQLTDDSVRMYTEGLKQSQKAQVEEIDPTIQRLTKSLRDQIDAHEKSKQAIDKVATTYEGFRLKISPLITDIPLLSRSLGDTAKTSAEAEKKFQAFLAAGGSYPAIVKSTAELEQRIQRMEQAFARMRGKLDSELSSLRSHVQILQDQLDRLLRLRGDASIIQSAIKSGPIDGESS